MYLDTRSLEKRYCNYGYGYDSDCDYYSPWNTWGRWVLLVVVIVVVLAIFFIFSCITARRRRKFGQQPFRGTGWMAPGHGQVNYYPNGGNQQSGQYYPQNTAGTNDPAPPYNPSTQGYYGQQSGYEMQPPPQTYQPGGQGAYAPPAGPPPGKQ